VQGAAGRAAVRLLLVALTAAAMAIMMQHQQQQQQQQLQLLLAVRVRKCSLGRDRCLLVLPGVLQLLLACCVCVSGRWLGWWHS
jgi:hypothetical protein